MKEIVHTKYFHIAQYFYNFSRNVSELPRLILILIDVREVNNVTQMAFRQTHICSRNTLTNG